MTRPDVAYHVSHLCQFMQDPSPDAYDAALGALAYLYHTKDLGLTYGGENSTGLECYADSSFGKTPYPFGGGFVKKNKCVLSYFSRKIKFAVPDSSCYAELAQLNITLKEAMFIFNLLEDMFVKCDVPVIYCDNKAAIDIIKNPGVTKRSVHYERWLFFARDAYLHLRANFVLVTTDMMMADSLTKVVDRTKFYICRQFMMNI